MHIKRLAILLLMTPFCGFAQKGQVKKDVSYPQDYFRDPLDIPIFLAGNFGECRPGHFHSGTDIKTKGEENQPVHAAADGYISRIKMEKGGFGHGLYITHPNGYTTLYAHLNDLAPAVQKYVRQQQYEKKRWDVDLELTPAQFPVKKGQLVAWSGNTGASTAPHLHFEIRNTKTEHPLNPQLFGLPIKDTRPPVPAEIAVYDLGKSIYEQVLVLLPVKKAGAAYVLAPQTKAAVKVVGDTVMLPGTDLTGIGVNADDYMEGSDNTINFLSAALYLDDSLQTDIRLDDIGYDVTRYVNAYADYRVHEQKGRWVQCLFKLPGNHLNNIYSYLNPRSGGFELTAGKAHKVRVLLTDDKGNTSEIVFYAKRAAPAAFPFAGNQVHFFANKPNQFSEPEVSFSLDASELYDNIDFVFDKSHAPGKYSARFALHYAYVPLHHYFDLRVKASAPVPAELAGKMVLRYTDGKEESGDAATPAEDGWFKTSVRKFGTYWLEADTVAPVIKPAQKNGANLSKATHITFDVKDALTSVKKFSGYLDGKWICFEQHGSTFFYKFDEHCPKGRHELIFTAADENGNESKSTLTFTR